MSSMSIENISVFCLITSVSVTLLIYRFSKKSIGTEYSLLILFIFHYFKSKIINEISNFLFLSIVFRYNDIPLVYDKQIYDQLVDSKIDEFMAQHVAHLFIRDSISLFSEKIHQDDEKEMDHFEVKIFFQ